MLIHIVEYKDQRCLATYQLRLLASGGRLNQALVSVIGTIPWPFVGCCGMLMAFKIPFNFLLSHSFCIHK